MLAVCQFIFGQISNVKVFTGTVNVGPPLSRGFFEIWLKNENDQFWGGKKIFPSILKKRHESLGTILYFFWKKYFFWIFFLLLQFFEKNYTFFWKNYISLYPLTQPNFTKQLSFLAFFLSNPTYIKLRKNQKSLKSCTVSPVEAANLFLRKTCFFDKFTISLNTAVVMHPNGPKCLRN